MKRLLFLFIMLPAILFSQENLKKTAENFVTEYFKLFEEKKWDSIPNAFAEDAQIVWLDGKVSSFSETMKPVLEKYKTDNTSIKTDVKWILTDILGSGSAMVTINFLEATDQKEYIQNTDNIYVFLLEQKDGFWKIKKFIPHQNLPFSFSENIDKKYQTGNAHAIFKAFSAINNSWSFILYDIEYFKEKGVSPAELGKLMGKRFAKSWNQSKGFEGLAEAFTWGLQVMSTHVKVEGRDETTFKAKFLSPFIHKTWDVTKEELLICTQNVWSEIADYMGATCYLTAEGNNWIITMIKKQE